MVFGTLLVCPHCSDCIEILGEPPSDLYLEEHRCECGAVLELAEGNVSQPDCYSRSAVSFDLRGG